MVNHEQSTLPVDPHELERIAALEAVVDQYLDKDDQLFLTEMGDESERIGYVYGRLLDVGEAPDLVLKEFGVTEEDNEV